MQLSIITINLNNASGLIKTINSVIAQKFTDYEYLIIDGGSTDNSLNILKEYSDNITSWISEPDTGIYNAMNKGILLSKGDYLLFLNSGDIMINSESLSLFFDSNGREDIIYGNLILKESNHQFIKYPYNPRLDFFDVWQTSLPHPATIIKKKVFEIVGKYNEDDKITSDWQLFMLALFKFNFNYRHIDKFISVFYTDGISNNPKYKKQADAERQKFMETYFPEIYNKRLFEYFFYIIKIKNKLTKKQVYWLDNQFLLRKLKIFFR